MTFEAREIRVRGVVQGVGFRPFVYRIATDLEIRGYAMNDGGGVIIHAESDPARLHAFMRALRDLAPPLARIDSLEAESVAPSGASGFAIIASSVAGSVSTLVPPDTATCGACLAELFDQASRRYRYPFINCTACGPRFTITRALPYDRERTTMARFVLCSACRREYDDPDDRRFHAEAIACAECGPAARLRVGDREHRGEGAIAEAVRLLSSGAIVAIKGLGGFHLAADARNDDAVAKLRERKRRPHRPFAVMARDLDIVCSIAEAGETARALLGSPAAPIVLMKKRREAAISSGVAPAIDSVGVMLASTPLHHLLLRDGPSLLLMTSGNIAGEPIVAANEDAIDRLAGVAEAFLAHDRDISQRIDDSVIAVDSRGGIPVRRARGSVPSIVRLRDCGLPLLAVGAEMKSTICVTRGAEAHLSQHIGDLANFDTFRAFEHIVKALPRLLGVTPEVVAHDLHPDYASTRWALAAGLPAFGVQHHHAHLASCLAEHGECGPVVGIAFDGTGCGPRGELWGGEIFIVTLADAERVAHLRPLALAGGEQAIREPWRLALAALVDAGAPVDVLERVGPRAAHVAHVLKRRHLAPLTTSAGRWFDAVASLCGIRDCVTYDAQAAIELEACAGDPAEPFPFDIEQGETGLLELDLRPAVREIAAAVTQRVSTSIISARFHETLARGTQALVRRVGGPATVALSGGCFQNRILTGRLSELLALDGRRVLTHREVPPNDGGISLGQAAVATHRLSR